MKEIFGNRFDVRVIIDGKEYYPKEVNLMSSDGASFKWKQRHWNIGEYEPECDNRALDIYHPQPQGLKKPNGQVRANPYQWKCVHCGHIKSHGEDHFSVKFVNGTSLINGHCETWVKSGHEWFLFNRTEW